MDDVLRSKLHELAAADEADHKHRSYCLDSMCPRRAESLNKLHVAVMDLLTVHGDGKTGFWEAHGVMDDYRSKHADRIQREYAAGSCDRSR